MDDILKGVIFGAVVASIIVSVIIIPTQSDCHYTSDTWAAYTNGFDDGTRMERNISKGVQDMMWAQCEKWAWDDTTWVNTSYQNSSAVWHPENGTLIPV